MSLRAPLEAAAIGRDAGEAPLVSLADLDAIEIVVRKRLREYTLGDHRSLFHGPGFDYVGLRSWEPGDRLSLVDWPQSSLSNFSPLIVRDFEQTGTAAVVVVADRSPSTQCGTDRRPVAQTIAWTIGTLGVSAALFQDAFGLITFDRGFTGMASVPAKPGRNQVAHCLDAYQYGRGLEPLDHPAATGHAGHTIVGALRRTSLVAVVSDFLFADADETLAELTHLNARHDLFLAMVDASAAFELPPTSAGWIRVHDVETGRSQLLSRRGVTRLVGRARAWQDDVAARAARRGLDLIRLDGDPDRAAAALSGFAAERRLRKQR